MLRAPLLACGSSQCATSASSISGATANRCEYVLSRLVTWVNQGGKHERVRVARVSSLARQPGGRALQRSHALWGGRRRTWGTSAATMARMPGVCGCSGSRYSLSVRAIVMRGARRLKPGGRATRGSTHVAAGRQRAATHAGRGTAPRCAPPTNADELLGVERAVPVLALGDGLGQHHACSVHRLPDVVEVDAPRDLLHRGGQRGAKRGMCRGKGGHMARTHAPCPTPLAAAQRHAHNSARAP